jgi:lactate dehydrogenase-like 2-hydroxyacid dehydrogenase
MALLLAAVRNIAGYNTAVQNGLWRDGIPWSPNVSGKRLGLLGLGDIGAKIARRAQAFDIDVGYHSRRARPDSPYAYYATLRALAQWCDFLVVATPGGAQTRHLVNTEVLDALGPAGFVVNIARGSVVDSAALGRAVRDGRIAGAALDVYEGEPRPSPELLGLGNVIFTPHIAGWSPEAVQNSVSQFLRNADGHFTGRGPVSPIVGNAAG